MSKTEILFYSPSDMDEFIRFCKKGIELDTDVPDTDEDGNEIFGVFSWLNGWGVQKAHFFHTSREDPMTFFMALVQKHEDDDQVRPWFRTNLSDPAQYHTRARHSRNQ